MPSPMFTASVSVSTPSVESRKHARSKCAFKMMMTTFSPPTYSCSRHPSPDKSASRRRRANRAPSERNRKKSTLRGNRDDSSTARARTLLLYSQLLYQIHRAPLRRRSIVTTPHSRNRASSSSAPRPTSRDSPGGARERLEECANSRQNASNENASTRRDRRAAASERTAKRRRECVHVDRLDHRARAVRAWLEFMNKIVIKHLL